MTTVTTQKVLERLVYEGLLLHNQYTGRRWRMRLDDVIEAGAAEPRIWELVPGILLHRPSLLSHRQRDLPRHAELARLIRHFTTLPSSTTWQGLPIGDLRKTATRIAQLTTQRRRTQKWRNLNLRVSEEDLATLNQLAQTLGINKSEVVRQAILHFPRS